MSLLTNLISYWKLDGNSNDAVGSNNGTDTAISYLGNSILTDDFNSYNDGTLNGQGSWVTDAGIGIFTIQGIVVKEGAKAVVGAGTDDITISKSGNNTPTGQITVYMRASATTGEHRFVLKEAGSRKIYIQFYTDGHIYLFNNDGETVDLGTYSADTWYAITIQWQVSDHKFRASIDGGTYSAWTGGTTTWTNLNAIQLDVRYHAGVLPYFDYIAENLVTIPSGKINQGAGFNGTTSKIVLVTAITPPSAFSVSAWIKCSSVTGRKYITGDWNVAGNVGWGFMVKDGKLRLELDNTPAYDRYESDDVVIAVDTWYHVCVTQASVGGTTLMYVNGSVVDNTLSTGGTYTRPAAQGTAIGRNGIETTSYAMEGAIDEVGIWDRELTSTEITDLYKSGLGNSFPFEVIYEQAVDATVKATSIALKAATKTVSSSAKATSTALKKVVKSFSTSAKATATSVKQALKTLASQIEGTVSLETIKTKLYEVAASITGTATLELINARILSATVTATVTVPRAISKKATVTVKATAKALKSWGVRIQARAEATAVVIKSFVVTLPAQISATVTIVQDTGRFIAASVIATASVTYLRMKILATNVTATATAQKTIDKIVQATPVFRTKIIDMFYKIKYFFQGDNYNKKY